MINLFTRRVRTVALTTLGWGVVVLSVCFATFAIAAPPAAAATNGVCPTADGVTVVVDFGPLGGGVHVRCVTDPLATGFDALRLAGFEIREPLNMAGFVCRVNNKPESDPCVNTSPTSAHWAYWLAARGASWCSASTGAMGRKPIAGTVEGWVFTQGQTTSSATPPAFPVPAAVPGSPTKVRGGQCDTSPTAPTAPPATIPPSATASAGGSTVGGATSTNSNGAPNAAPAPAGSGIAAAQPNAAPTTAPAVTAAPTTTTPATSTTVPGAAADAEPTTTTAAESAEADVTEQASGETVAITTDDSGSPVGLIATGGAIAALAAGVVIMRRRERDPGGAAS